MTKWQFYCSEYHASVNTIAYGYARAGNHDQVEFYRKQYHASVDDIAYGYAVEGNHDQVEFYCSTYHANINNIAHGYAMASDHDKRKKYDMKYLLENYLSEREEVRNASGETKEYFYGSFFSTFQKSFTQKREAVEALMLALNGDHIDLRVHLATLRNGHLGQALRAFIKSGMADTLVKKEVTTVRAFVQALHEKNANQIQPLNHHSS